MLWPEKYVSCDAEPRLPRCPGARVDLFVLAMLTWQGQATPFSLCHMSRGTVFGRLEMLRGTIFTGEWGWSFIIIIDGLFSNLFFLLVHCIYHSRRHVREGKGRGGGGGGGGGGRVRKWSILIYCNFDQGPGNDNKSHKHYGIMQLTLQVTSSLPCLLHTFSQFRAGAGK